MKKLLSLLAAWLLLCASAQAATLPYGEETILSVLALTDDQRALADFLYVPVFNMEAEIALPDKTRYEDVSAAMTCLMQDYPELFHLGRNYTVHYYVSAPEYATAVTPEYRMSAGEAADLRAELYVRAWMTASGQEAQSLHDHLVASVAYGGSDEMRHTAVGALLQGEATCEGYAQALTLLYRMAGIPCGVVTGVAVDERGHAEGHSWNIARLADFTLIDATWNDQGGIGLNTCWYYGLSTAQMGVDHFPGEGQEIPACGEQDNWHRKRGFVIAAQADMDAALHRLADGETVNLRIANTALYQAFTADPHACVTAYNERHPEAAFYGAYSIVTSDAQQCVILQRTE